MAVSEELCKFLLGDFWERFDAAKELVDVCGNFGSGPGKVSPM